jgi:hypothetical protein
VVSGTDGVIRSFRAADGAALWSKPVGVEIYDMEPGLRKARGTPGTAAITDSTVWVASLDGNLYALDLATGAERWRWGFGVPVASSPAVSGNMLFLAAEDEHLYGFVAAEPVVGASLGTDRRAAGLSLHPPRPNPSAGLTRFEWTLPEHAHVRLSVFDAGGRLVRVVVDGPLEAGAHAAEWDGRDGRGSLASAGVYFARIEAGGRVAARRLVRLHR